MADLLPNSGNDNGLSDKELIKEIKGLWTQGRIRRAIERAITEYLNLELKQPTDTYKSVWVKETFNFDDDRIFITGGGREVYVDFSINYDYLSHIEFIDDNMISFVINEIDEYNNEEIRLNDSGQVELFNIKYKGW